MIDNQCYGEFKAFLLNAYGVKEEQVDYVLNRIECPVLIDNAIFIPTSHTRPIDYDEAFVNGIIVKFMVARPLDDA